MAEGRGGYMALKGELSVRRATTMVSLLRARVSVCMGSGGLGNITNVPIKKKPSTGLLSLTMHMSCSEKDSGSAASL